MTVTADTLRKLAALGLSAEQLSGVLQILADQVEAEERRKAAQRERKARQRDKSRDSHGTKTGTSQGQPPKESFPQTPFKEITPNQVSEPSGSSTMISPEPGEPAPVAVVLLPTVAEGDVPISEADVAEWQMAYPAVNVRQQLAAIRQWLIANPTKRKTRRGMRRFVNSWLDRRQNAAPRAAYPPQSTSPPHNERSAMNDTLDRLISGARNEHEPHTIDASFHRTDRGSPESSFQRLALPARD